MARPGSQARAHQRADSPKRKRCRPKDVDNATPTIRTPLAPVPPATIQALSSKLGRQKEKEVRAVEDRFESFRREAAQRFTSLEVCS